MAFSDEQKRTFREAALPLMKWLAQNANPHTKVIVTNRHAELEQGAISFVDESLVNDAEQVLPAETRDAYLTLHGQTIPSLATAAAQSSLAANVATRRALLCSRG